MHDRSHTRSISNTWVQRVDNLPHRKHGALQERIILHCCKMAKKDKATMSPWSISNNTRLLWWPRQLSKRTHLPGCLHAVPAWHNIMIELCNNTQIFNIIFSKVWYTELMCINLRSSRLKRDQNTAGGQRTWRNYGDTSLSSHMAWQCRYNHMTIPT